VDENTLFDMASVTKIMATTSLALIALDRKLIDLETPISNFFSTEKPLTIKHLLTHTIGIGHKSLDKAGNTYENIAQVILGIEQDIPIGENVLYSCPGFILLGKVLEKVFGERLDMAFQRHVARPLVFENTGFLPKTNDNCVNSNLLAEECGKVNDYNCRFLGGVAGNAGLFSSVNDVEKYVQCLLNKGEPLFSRNVFEMAVKNYTAEKTESRGLGFVYVDNRYSQTGGLFEDGAIGHGGHTGQSVFLDYRTGLYVIVLSDATITTVKKYGSEKYDEVIKMREKIHAAIKSELE
jgi:CubicO group peptidase (beta-lactamase class C family)